MKDQKKAQKMGTFRLEENFGIWKRERETEERGMKEEERERREKRVRA